MTAVLLIAWGRSILVAVPWALEELRVLWLGGGFSAHQSACVGCAVRISLLVAVLSAAVGGVAVPNCACRRSVSLSALSIFPSRPEVLTLGACTLRSGKFLAG